MRTARRGCVLCAAALAFLWAGAAPAATFTVTKTADTDDGACDADCSLREAIIAANVQPGSDTVEVPAGTYVLTIRGRREKASATGDLNITDDLVLAGAGPGVTAIDGNAIDRVLSVLSQATTVEISGVTIQNGSGMADTENLGGGIANLGRLSLTNCTVSGNATASNDGGGIINGGSGTVTLTDCTVTGNTGGGIGNAGYPGGSVTLTNSTVSSNTGRGIMNSGASSTLTLINSTVSGNTARGDGGGIMNSNGGSVTLTNSTVSGNTAYDGGGIANTSIANYTSSVTLTNCIVSGNTATSSGGGITNGFSSTFTLTNSTVSDNSASTGAGIMNDSGGSVTLIDSTVSSNTASNNGGGIMNSSSSLTLTNCTVSGNTAVWLGGGGMNYYGSVTLTNSTVSANSANNGAGIMNFGRSAILTNCTVSGNTARGFGGFEGGGMDSHIGASLSLTNSIVAANSPANCGRFMTSHGHHNMDDDGSCPFTAPGDLSHVPDAKLVPLQDNGGPTETHALLAGSPAIDAGDNASCPPTDQRGRGRVDGACDIGAFEFLAPVTTLILTPASGGNTGSVTITVTIYGAPFTEGSTVRLARAGQADIVGEPATVGANARTLRTTFDLTGKAPGAWDLVVTNPDGTSTTRPGRFTVEEGGAPRVWVDIIGRNTFRAGREQTFYVTYGNRGNVDALGVPLWIAGIPRDAAVKLGFDVISPRALANSTPIDWSRIPLLFDADDEKALPLFIPQIPPGVTKTLKISVNVPTARNFRLRSWVNPPSFGSSLHQEVVECNSAILAVILDLLGLVPGVACGVQVDRLLVELYSQSLVLAGQAAGSGDEAVFSLQQMFFSAVFTLVECVNIGTETIVMALPRGLKLALDISIAIDECREAWKKEGEKTLGVDVVTSFDPNDKFGSRGVGEVQYLSDEEPLRYAVFFANVETATAPVQELVITDPLDVEKTDLTTVSLGPISFGDEQVVPPAGVREFSTDVDLQPAEDLLVRVNVRLDADTGLLTWRLTSIDPATGQPPEDPLVGFLPPNVNPPEGEGNVVFTVMPKPGLPTGTEIRNRATIVFDANPPIDTAEWFNTLDNTVPTGQVLPLATTQDSASFEVQWSGADEGSGVHYYTIFVSENGGPYSVWLRDTTNTSGVFTGQPGKRYAFYSVARDGAGNIEDAPMEPDAETTVAGALCVGDCDSDGVVTVNEILTMVKIALGDAVSACAAGDASGDGQITVDEILTAVNNALNGCT